MLLTIILILTIMFFTSLIALVMARQKNNYWISVVSDQKTMLIFIACAFLLFLSYFAGTANLLQLEQTINVGGEIITIQNNNYLFFYNFLPVVQGLFGLISLLCISTIFRKIEFFGRSRMN